MPEFVTVARKGDIPEGEGRSIAAGGKTIALFHVGGKFHALEDACLHRGGPLGEGTVEGSVVTCPWHQWQFDLATGLCRQDGTIRAVTYPVRLEGEDVQVAI